MVESDKALQIICRSLDNSTDSSDTMGIDGPSGRKSNFEYKRKFGWSFFRPDCLQIFNKPCFFLLCLCTLVFGQGLACSGINNTMLTSIEKQYGFNVTQIGIFSTLYHTSAGIFVSLVCYFGHRQRPLTLGIGCIFLCFGLFTITIPYYIIPGYEAGVAMDSDTCRQTNNSTLIETINQCHNTISGRSKYFSIFVVGYCLLGLGVTPLFSLGYAHLDDIVEGGKSSLYFSAMGVSAALGPAAGFLIANPILKVFVDLKQPPNSNLTPTDRNWVGAWWIGYLVGAGILLLPIIPLLGFPSIFPNAEKIQKKKEAMLDTVKANKALKHDLRSLLPATKALLKNVPFVCISLGIASESFAIGGLSIFTPKLAETQFGMTSAKAALIIGAIVVLGASGGVFTGGYMCKRFKWNCMETLRNATIMALIAVIFSSFALFGCNGRNVVGTDAKYFNTTSLNGFESTCNQNCQCSTSYYKPVCSVSDQLTYYSPCHAGCSSENAKLIDGIKKFSNCSCVPTGYEIQDGRCKQDHQCHMLSIFFLLAILFVFFTFMNNVPLLNSIFRVVPEGQGSFAMGLQHMVVRFLGFIPTPTVFGHFIDRSCKLWQRDECTGETTSCLEYENTHFRNSVFVLVMVSKTLSLLFIFIAYKTYKLPPKSMMLDKKLQTTYVNKNQNSDEQFDNIQLRNKNTPEM